MAYQVLPLTDNETVIDKKLLDHLQNGIYKAHTYISTAIQAVSTAAGMDAIIENATKEDRYKFVMYLGETTASYKKGAVYQIVEV